MQRLYYIFQILIYTIHDEINLQRKHNNKLYTQALILWNIIDYLSNRQVTKLQSEPSNKNFVFKLRITMKIAVTVINHKIFQSAAKLSLFCLVITISNRIRFSNDYKKSTLLHSETRKAPGPQKPSETNEDSHKHIRKL